MGTEEATGIRKSSDIAVREAKIESASEMTVYDAKRYPSSTLNAGVGDENLLAESKC